MFSTLKMAIFYGAGLRYGSAGRGEAVRILRSRAKNSPTKPVRFSLADYFMTAEELASNNLGNI
jgi:hypothetical protein